MTVKHLIFFFKSNYSFLVNFFNGLNKFSKLKKTKVYNKASEYSNEFLETYFDEYYDLSLAKTKNMESKYKPKNSFLKKYN